MIECRACRALYRAPADRIGARCPKCRMPLFERAERGQPPETGLGACVQHPERTAVLLCQQCKRPMCAVCRTRWFAKMICPACVEAAATSDQPTPRELKRLGGRAAWSVILAGIAWAVLGLVALLFLAQPSGKGLTFMLVCAILTCIPAAFAVGQGCAVLLVRGPRRQAAQVGMFLGGAHLGLLVGLLFVNLWHN